MTSVCRQLRHSMGGFMWIMTVAALVVYVILMYLLTKLMIEKNARSISLVKILGYDNREILRLYLRPTLTVVLISQIITLPVDNVLMAWIWRLVVLLEMSGWLGYTSSVSILAGLGAVGIVLFVITAAVEYRRIRRIPMVLALKSE